MGDYRVTGGVYGFSLETMRLRAESVAMPRGAAQRSFGPASPVLRHVPDQRRQARRAVPRGRLRAAHVDGHREFLAQLDAELIEGIHAPHGSLYEDAVLVQSQQLAHGSRAGLRV